MAGPIFFKDGSVAALSRAGAEAYKTYPSCIEASEVDADCTVGAVSGNVMK